MYAVTVRNYDCKERNHNKKANVAKLSQRHVSG
jgi:hypothetical protein